MEVILLVALVVLMVLFAARATRHQRIAVRVPVRMNQPQGRRRR